MGSEASQESDKALQYAVQATEEEMVPRHQGREGLGSPAPQCRQWAKGPHEERVGLAGWQQRLMGAWVLSGPGVEG